MKSDGLPRVQVISAGHILTDSVLAPANPVFDYLKASTK
jgi:acetoacetate decarboxylase